MWLLEVQIVFSLNALIPDNDVLQPHHDILSRGPLVPSYAIDTEQAELACWFRIEPARSSKLTTELIGWFACKNE
jgi:hypothetical protein